MRRDTLEVSNQSIFKEKIQKTFGAADAEAVVDACDFISERAYDPGAPHFQAANILLDQHADSVTIVAALLAPLFWSGRVYLDEIRNRFGQTVAETLDTLDAPLLHVDARCYRRGDLHELLTSMARVPRTAILRIAFRLVALERVVTAGDGDARDMAQETLDFYVPIASMVGLGELRRRLEDVCFHIIDPNGYEDIKRKVAPICAEDDKCLQILLSGVQRLLANNGMQGRVQGRAKSLYSINRKLRSTGKTIEEIMDRIGLRIIVSSVPECYTVLGLLHSHFKPIPGTFDDYIGLPKDNGYQSLHTCVYPVREISHKPIEFQVRTELMHMEAEYGAAAHWLYKNEATRAEQERTQARRIGGLARQHAEAESAEAFIELLHRQVFQNHLVVFGTGGRIVRLAEKAKVKDYLRIWNVHLPPGAVVKVNGRVVPTDWSLKDGDSIEIVENYHSHEAQAAVARTEAAPGPQCEFRNSLVTM